MNHTPEGQPGLEHTSDKQEDLFSRLPELPEIKQLVDGIEDRQTERIKLELDSVAPELHEVSEQVAELTKNLNPVELYTVDNVADHKKKFLEAIGKKDEFNPTFSYEQSIARLDSALTNKDLNRDTIRQQLKELRSQLRKTKYDNELDRIAKVALVKKIEDEMATIKLAEGLELQDESLIKDALTQKYGAVSEEVIEAAELIYQDALSPQETAPTKGIIPPELVAKLSQPDLLNDPVALSEIKKNDPERRKFYVDAQEMAQAYQWVLDSYYDNYRQTTGKEFPPESRYKIEISERYTSIDVRDKSSEGRVIGIPKNRIVDQARLLELLAHEIEGHARQSFNGETLFKLGGGILKGDAEILYEGLAIHNEDKINLELFGRPSSVPHEYAFRILAIDSAQQGKSFVETFKEIKKRLLSTAKYKDMDQAEADTKTDDAAWLKTYRAFRGHIHTDNRQPFAMTKDSAYLEGWLLHRQLKKNGLGYLNESAIAQTAALPLLARIDYSAEDLPFPDLNATRQYWEKILKPKLES